MRAGLARLNEAVEQMLAAPERLFSEFWWQVEGKEVSSSPPLVALVKEGLFFTHRSHLFAASRLCRFSRMAPRQRALPLKRVSQIERGRKGERTNQLSASRKIGSFT